jgi:hypothetical protein
MKIQQGIPQNRRLEVITWAFEYFKHVTGKDYFFAIIAQETNWDLSLMLVDENDVLKGCYLFGDQQVDSIIDTDEFKDMKGIEGILLAVDKEIQGQGWGNKLKDYPKTLKFDYIWGQQLKTLGNLKDWLKRRYLYAETDSVYITIEKFK